ncbi:MAG: glycine zipper 2TM domain-containing protein [Nevskia sp.]|nr:glycine zipper 2TM domain-containing protein [Nevskia sp.]
MKNTDSRVRLASHFPRSTIAGALGAAAVLGLSACVMQPPVEDAQVMSAVPVTFDEQVPVQQQVCDAPPPGPNQQGSVVGALVGGALGGLVGNQFGRGSGNAAMTALGAVGGAVAGSQVGANTQAPGNCHIVQSYTTRRVTQYDVTYQYQGQVYHTRMNYNPGPVLHINNGSYGY